MKHLSLFALFLFLLALVAAAHEPIPVYGPARTAMDDDDLLPDTILEPGVLAISPTKPWKLYVGDGITPGGIPIHAEGCVTNFNGVSVATTNLDMRSWSIKWGPWSAHGDANEWDLGYGLSEVWLRLVRDTGLAYLSYDFTILDNGHFLFSSSWSDDATLPVLEVSTNLVDGYTPADDSQVTYTRVDASHVTAEFTPEEGADYFYSFRFFAAQRMATGIYAREPLVAEKGLTVVSNGVTANYYKLGSYDTNEVPNSVDSTGLFQIFSTVWSPMYLQIGTNAANGILNVGTRRAYDFLIPPALNLFADNGPVNISAGRSIALKSKDATITSTNASSGVTLTNSANGEFSVTWNGVTLTNWTDLVQWFVRKWPYDYLFETSNIPSYSYPYLATNLYALRLGSYSPGITLGLHSKGNVGLFAPNSSIFVRKTGDTHLTATNAIHLETPSVVADGDVKAASFTVGTNDVMESVASVERRVGALEDAAWSELYTQWTGAVLSPTATNWIPTNLPARSVVVCMALNSTNTIQNLNFGIPGGWEPEEDCMVSFRILRTASGPTWHCFIGNKEVNAVTSGNGRIALVFRWIAGAKMWVLWRWTLQYDNAVFDSTGTNKETVGIPCDERFLPVIDEATP